MSARDDRIAYPIIRNGGGMDGRDPSDKGGICSYAPTFEQAQAEVKELWGGGDVGNAIVINFDAELAGIRASLSPLQRYVLKEKLGIDLGDKIPKLPKPAH